MKHISKVLVFALVIAFVMSVAAPAFAGGIEGWPVEGKAYPLVSNRVAFKSAAQYMDPSWMKSFGKYYGTSWELYTDEPTPYYTIIYRSGGRWPTYWGISSSKVEVIYGKVARPTVRFYYGEVNPETGTPEVERAVIRAKTGTKLWAPEPFMVD